MYRCSKCDQPWDDKQAQDNECICTRRCGGRLEPLPPLGLADLEGCDFRALPYPIALTAARLASDLQASSDFLKTLFLLKDCIEATIKFCSAILLAEYRLDPVCTPEHNEKLLARIVRPSLGDWVNNIVRPLSLWLHAGPPSPGRQVAALFAGPGEKPGANPIESDLFQRCKDFVNYRNDALGHGANRPDAVYQRDLADWLPLVRRLLDGVASLCPWRLCLATAPDRCQEWMGPQPSSAVVPGTFPQREIGHFVVRGAAGSGFLDLNPFVCYLPDSRMENRLHYYDSIHRYQLKRKEATVLEYDNGERHPSRDPVPGLEEAFTRELLEQAFYHHRKGMEIIEGHVVNSDELIETHSDIVGRRFVIDHVHRFLAEHDRGLLVIQGQPGTGKTALLAHLIVEVFGHSAPQPVHFFYRRTAGITDPTICVRSLYAALLKAHGMTEAEESKRKNSPAEVFIKLTYLLSQEISPRLMPVRPQLIFIDALDEATGNAFQQIPADLPAGVYIIASTRPVADRTTLARRQGLSWFDLDDPDLKQQNYRDGFEYVQRELVASKLPNETLGEVARLGAGNFLVLKLLCQHVSASLRPNQVGEFLRRVATDGSKDQLGFIYQEFWERLTQRCTSEDVVLLCDVAAVLVAAHAWLTADMICQVLDLKPGKWDFVLRRLAEYLTVVPRDHQGTEESFYRIYHESFADFLRVKVAIDPGRHRRLLADYCLRWADQPNGYGRDYALVFAPRHLIEAADWKGLAALAPAERPDAALESHDFSQACAARFETWDGLRAAREIAEGLAQRGNEHWEAFIRCADRYCDLSEELRGNIEGLARMIERGETNRVVALIEGDADRFRRGLFMILLATPMRRHGHESLAFQLEHQGTAYVAAQLEGQKQTLPGHSPVTVRLAYTLVFKVNAPGAEPPGFLGSSQAAGPETPEAPHPTVPLSWTLLGYLNRASERFFPMALALLFSAIGYAIILSQLPDESAVARIGRVLVLGLLAASLVGGWVLPLLFHFFRDLAPVQRRLLRIMGRLREQAESPIADDRRSALKQAARLAHLWQAVQMPESWANDLARIVERGFSLVSTNPPEAAKIVSEVVPAGGPAGDALIAQIKQVDPLQREAIRTAILVGYEAGNAKGLEMVRVFVQHAAGSSGRDLLRIVAETASESSDPTLLLDFLEEYSPEPHELKSVGGDPRAAVAAALAWTPVPYLRKAVSASLDRDRSRETAPRRSRVLRRLRRNVRRWFSLRDPLRMIGNLIVLLLLAPLLAMTILFPLIMLEFVLFTGVVLLAGRRHDTYLLSRTTTGDGAEAWRLNLVQRLSETEWPAPRQGAKTDSEPGPMEQLGLGRLVGWMLAPIAMRRLRDTLLAQAILRKDGFLLAFFSKSVFGRVLRRLTRNRLVRHSDGILAVMNDRRLLNSAVRAAPAENDQPREVAEDEDGQQLRRVLPLEPAWLSFGLVAALSCFATVLVLGMLSQFVPASAQFWLIDYGIWEGLAVCLVCAVWQHVPSLLIEFGIVSDPGPRATPSGRLRAWLWRATEFLRNILFSSRDSRFPMLAGVLLLGFLFIGHAYLRPALVRKPLPGGNGLLFLVPPFLITNLLVPALIARWRGAALLYPDPSRKQLLKHQFGAVVVFAGCGFLVFGVSWLGTWSSYPLLSLRFVFLDHDDVINAVAISPDGKYLASACDDNKVRLWDFETGREILTGLEFGGPVSSVAFSPGGNNLAASSLDHTIRIWEVPSGREIRTVVLSPFDYAWEITYSADGKYLLAAVPSYSLAVAFLFQPLSPLPFIPPRTIGNIHVYEAATGEKVQSYPLAHWDSISSVAFDPDGKSFASGGSDRLVKIWDRQQNAQTRALAGHDGTVTEVAYSRDGKWLGSASADLSIILWNAQTGDQIGDLKGHGGTIQWIGFHPTRPLLVSAGSDGTARIWDVTTGMTIAQITGEFVFRGGAISPDGRFFALGGTEGKVTVWELDLGEP